jgi:DNA-binding CsgD family transcriptional regulator
MGEEEALESAVCCAQVSEHFRGFAVRYFFHVSDQSSTTKDEDGTVLSGREVAMLRAAVIAAELTRDGEYRQGYLVCVVDQHGNEIARCRTSPRPETTPGEHEPASDTPLRQIDGRPVAQVRAPVDQPGLTAREREVLTWISLGKSAWEIGEILGIAKRTVDEHAQTATRKLGAANRTQAVAIAVRAGLIEF